MGALFGVKVYYVDLEAILKKLTKRLDAQIYGAFMDGASIYQSDLSANGIIVMGSEGQGYISRRRKINNKKADHPLFCK